MGRLERFAKEGGKVGVLATTVRVPADLYQEFKEYVEALGLTMNEAIVKLIELEMKDVREKKKVEGSK